MDGKLNLDREEPSTFLSVRNESCASIFGYSTQTVPKVEDGVALTLITVAALCKGFVHF